MTSQRIVVVGGGIAGLGTAALLADEGHDVQLFEARDQLGGRAGSYETVLRDARQQALSELADEARKMGANAVVGIDLDYEVLGQGGSMLMISASGTAVTVY